MNNWVWKGIIATPRLPTFRNEFVITSEASILFYHKKIIGLELVA